VTDQTAIPAGYYAVPDPNNPDVITYWRRTSTSLAAWPAKARYGPPLPRRSELPPPGPERDAFVKAWHATSRAYLDQIVAAITAEIVAAGKRFADFGIRCCQCGRALRDATSKTYGIGPDCRTGMDPAWLAHYLTPRVGRAHAEHLAATGTAPAA
jgi:hypothetical protein